MYYASINVNYLNITRAMVSASTSIRQNADRMPIIAMV